MANRPLRSANYRFIGSHWPTLPYSPDSIAGAGGTTGDLEPHCIPMNFHEAQMHEWLAKSYTIEASMTGRIHDHNTSGGPVPRAVSASFDPVVVSRSGVGADWAQDRFVGGIGAGGGGEEFMMVTGRIQIGIQYLNFLVEPFVVENPVFALFQARLYGGVMQTDANSFWKRFDCGGSIDGTPTGAGTQTPVNGVTSFAGGSATALGHTIPCGTLAHPTIPTSGNVGDILTFTCSLTLLDTLPAPSHM